MYKIYKIVEQDGKTEHIFYRAFENSDKKKAYNLCDELNREDGIYHVRYESE